MTDAEVIAQVTDCIREATRTNKRTEQILIGMLTAIFLAGLVFLIAGFATRQWTLALPGSICELALAWPIKSLIRLRRENILLEILPNTLRLASADARKELVFKFVERLINQV